MTRSRRQGQEQTGITDIQQSEIHTPQSKNRALLVYIVLPFIFLTVALLGGLRISSDDGAFVFFPPPLVTLLLAVLLMLLFLRGGLLELRNMIASHIPPIENASNIWLLLTLFFASAQAFNSVLPERGLLHWLFSFFFLWTLWNNQFSSFDARRLLRSLIVLFGTAFILKHMLLTSLFAADGGWLKRIAGALVQGAALGTLDAPAFAPATGYISFFGLALYVIGLTLTGTIGGKPPALSLPEPNLGNELIAQREVAAISTHSTPVERNDSANLD